MRFYGNFLGHEPADIFNSRGHRCKEIEEINLQNYRKYIDDFYDAQKSEMLKKQEEIKLALREKQEKFFISKK